MYRRIGRLTPPASLLSPTFLDRLVWNPPGWASFSSLDLVRELPKKHDDARLAQLIAIKPGGYIPFHTDNPAVENAIDVPLRRYHVVLSSNSRCWNFHDGTWQQLEVGGIYTMDPFREHASINLGATTRVHLVVDIAMPGQPLSSEAPVAT